jgi:hypothetical protein
MDGISAAAAVIGLVQAGTQVTIALRRYISSAKEADSSRAKLLDQMKLMSAAETTIESIVRNSSPSSHTPGLQTLIDEWFKDLLAHQGRQDTGNNQSIRRIHAVFL